VFPRRRFCRCCHIPQKLCWLQSASPVASHLSLSLSLSLSLCLSYSLSLFLSICLSLSLSVSLFLCLSLSLSLSLSLCVCVSPSLLPLCRSEQLSCVQSSDKVGRVSQTRLLIFRISKITSTLQIHMLIVVIVCYVLLSLQSNYENVESRSMFAMSHVTTLFLFL
jgi:hypothetical protein